MSASARRKRLQENEDDADEKPTASKKAKTSDEMVWEWEGDGSNWTAYDENMNKEINTAFKSGKPKIALTNKTTKLEVIFARLVQRNTATGWERRVRIKPFATEEKWKWQDEYHNWNEYSDHVNTLLNAGKLCGLKTVEFSMKGAQYQVNLIKQEQANKNTKVRRKVRITGDDDDNEDEVAASAVPVSVKRESKAESKPLQRRQNSLTKVKPEPEETQKKGESNAASNIKSKSVIKKGKVPVDPDCPAKNTHHVLCEGKDIWDAMLNQTNLKNNNNKFYLMQLLEEDNAKRFAVWFRWGRVGATGQSNLVRCGNDLEEAKEVFSKKFENKTHNDWDDRNRFQKVQGKYDLLKMDYDANSKDDEVDAAEEKTVKREDSKLDKRIQALVELICNVQEMEEAVLEMKYDSKKAPLGKLTKDQIKAGYSALKKIDACISQKNFGDGLVKACDEFYTRIPHVFGMQRPPLIRTKEDLQKKLDLLEALGDIEIALKVISENKNMLEHPIDRHYHALNCDIDALEREDEEFDIVEKYVQNTHAATHNTYKMEVQEVYKLKKPGEEENFKDLGNKKLLWHGSRLTNYVGILKKGLRIAPPEAPVTGYMFGKGVYFADISSKSANYCYPSRSKRVGLVMLCEVALGKPRELLAADYDADNLPKGFNSVMGLGRVAPDPSDDHTLSDGTIVPYGKPKDTGVTNPNGYTLNYNEYIVYDTKQIKCRYLVQVKFLFS